MKPLFPTKNDCRYCLSVGMRVNFRNFILSVTAVSIEVWSRFLFTYSVSLRVPSAHSICVNVVFVFVVVILTSKGFPLSYPKILNHSHG